MMSEKWRMTSPIQQVVVTWQTERLRFYVNEEPIEMVDMLEQPEGSWEVTRYASACPDGCEECGTGDCHPEPEIMVTSPVARIVYPLKPWIAWTLKVLLVLLPMAGAFALGWIWRG